MWLNILEENRRYNEKKINKGQGFFFMVMVSGYVAISFVAQKEC
jgi:hypothetical protein